MREIKFRRPLLDSNGKFYAFQYWGFIWLHEGDCRFAAPRFPSTTGDRMGDDQEYLGLHAKNGVEIYEGDRLGGRWGDSYIAWCEKCKAFQIFSDYNDGCQRCSGDTMWDEIVEDDGNLEIDGNIYEKKEG